MSNPVLRAIRSLAFSYVYAQAIVILSVAVLLYFFGSSNTALSFLWGGMICILPNAYFAHKLFARTGATATRQIITSFYISEVVKFVITILLFVIAFKFFNFNKIALFLGYIVAQFTFWFAALFRHRAVNKL